MKTILDLPDGLFKQVELRASHEGRQVNDVAADLLRIGLATPPANGSSTLPPVMKIHPLTQLPYFECGPDAPAREMTTEQLLALEQDILMGEDSERLGLSPRQ